MSLKISKRMLKIIAVVIFGILLLVALFCFLKALEGRLDPPLETVNAGSSPNASGDDLGGAVYFEDKQYFPKKGLTTVLVIGIDDFGPVSASGSYNNGGQSDFIALFVFDDNAESYTVLQLNRDTMSEIPMLSVEGKKAGTVTAQLALAHTYGDGLADSCENTVDAVSYFLYDTQIDNYISLNMDAVAALNDTVGGVPVEITDDFSDVDSSLVMGSTVTLTGKQALTFVRARGSMADSTNLKRMERQKQYLASLAECVKSSFKQNDDFALKVYDAVCEYMVTDFTVNAFSTAAGRFSEYSFGGVVTPVGESRIGAEFVEFYTDSDSVRKLVLSLFYVE